MSSDDSSGGAGYSVKEIVVRLEGKLDKILDDHEKRLRVLEGDKNQRVGRSSLVLSGLSFIAAASAVAGVFFH